MSSHKYIEIEQQEEGVLVHFTCRRIIDRSIVEDLAQELYALIEKRGILKIVLSFHGVEFLSTAALNRLIILERKVRKANGVLVLSSMCQQIHTVFTITKLDEVFNIRFDDEETLACIS